MDLQIVTHQGSQLEPRVSELTSSVVALSSALCLEVPPEIWGLVATISSRESIVHLCAVSHRFYSIFSPLLYRMTCDPPLTVMQSSLLMTTIRTAVKAHPALLIRNLSINRYSPSYEDNDAPQCRETLNNLVDMSSSSCRGATLRALEWDLSTGIDELGRFLRKPGYFPNLKKIAVRSEGRNIGFEVLQCPSLEEIECSLILGDSSEAYDSCADDVAYYATWRSLWDALHSGKKDVLGRPKTLLILSVSGAEGRPGPSR
ncbi:hypothetical protein C8R47DRAFT_501885 [Mycena vitilis]|nr:hypothetical protein C8R47DRAFT_501885 [Mycena vitilis]